MPAAQPGFGITDEEPEGPEHESDQQDDPQRVNGEAETAKDGEEQQQDE
jgi:hypothetical protein